MTPEQIFGEILNHMVKGLMVHEQLANYYDFLGFQGYRQCHEYHFLIESKSYRKLCHYYTKKYNQVLPEFRFETPDVIPTSWRGYYRQQVDSQTKQKAVRDGLDLWVNWEEDTCALYEQMYKELSNLGEYAASIKVSDLIKEVECELQKAEQYRLNKLSIDYDMNTIIEEQKSLHNKYETKCKEV